MIEDSDSRARAGAFRFLIVFAVLAGLGFAVIAAGHWLLARADLLPPPPVVANACIDKKLAYLTEVDLSIPSVVAIGSSTTLRNLDMRVFERRLGRTALNAAPCYLYMDQTAVLAEFLLDRLTALEMLLVVVHPRDFKTCDAKDRDFFNEWTLSGYLDGWLPNWWPYITGLRPFYLVKHVLAQHKQLREGGGLTLVPDGLGSEFLGAFNGWNPELVIDERCFEGVEQLVSLSRREGFELVLVLLPHEAKWRTEHDPDGTRLAAWASRLTAVAGETVQVIDTRDLDWPTAHFSDPVHLLAPYVPTYSEIVAERLLARTLAQQ
ncbi:MAG: hypothetical protein ACFCUJ_04945 [Thiotrichales bacterium]